MTFIQHCLKFNVRTFRDALGLGHSISQGLGPKAM